MESVDLWSSKLSSSSFRRYQLRSDVYMGDDMEVEDELKQEYSCPFCADEFDVVGLFCHMDGEHKVELKNGVCPICVKRVGVDMVGHITTQHGNILKVQRKRVLRRGVPNSMFNMLRKELREGNRQSLFGGSSIGFSSSNPDPDPLLSSFICSSDTANDLAVEGPRSFKVACSHTEAVSEKRSASTQQPAISKKDHEEKAKKSKFVQGLLLSAMLDDVL